MTRPAANLSSGAAAPGGRRRGAMLAVCAAGVLWGASAVVIRAAFNQHVDPFALAQARLALAFPVLGLGLLLASPRSLRISPADLGPIAIWALFGLLLMQVGYLWAVSLAGVATAVFLQYTSPLMTSLWERVSTRGPRGRSLLGALALSLIGIAALLFGAGDRPNLTGLAIFAGLLAAFGNAFMVVHGRRVLGRRAPTTVLFYGMGVALVATLLLQRPSATLALWPAHAGQVLFIATGATLVPFLLYLYGAASLAPTHTIMLAMIEPVVALLGAWAVLEEQLTAVQLGGAGLVLAGVAIAQRRASGSPGTGEPASEAAPLTTG